MMKEYSIRVTEIIRLLYVRNDVKNADIKIDQLEDEIDQSFAQAYKTFNLFAFHNPKLGLQILEEIESKNLLWKNTLLEYIVHQQYFMYYNGFNSPVVDMKKSEFHFKTSENLFQKLTFDNNFTKWYTIGCFHISKAQYLIKRKNLDGSEESNSSAIEAYSNIDDEEFRVTFVALGHNNLGDSLRKQGKFEEAEKAYLKALEGDLRYNTYWQLWRMYNLALVSRLRGNLQNAHYWNDKRLQSSLENNNIYGIFSSLTLKARIQHEEGLNNDSLRNHIKSLEYRKQYKEPLQKYWGAFNLFNFYISRLTSTKDQSFLLEVKNKYEELESISRENSSNQLMTDYTLLSKALLLKRGNLRKKGEAINILETLLKKYPNNQAMLLNLLELLFEDANAFGDQDTFNQIEDLMNKIETLPLRDNPQAVIEYVSQQIIVAKYVYFIKGEVSNAVSILNTAKDTIKEYKLDYLYIKLTKEIEFLEDNVKQWDRLLVSAADVTQRIKQAEFEKYIQDAIEEVKKL